MVSVRSDKSRKIWIIGGLVGLVSLLHYVTPLHQPFSHVLFARFYYLPILLGGFWFGIGGGIRVSLLVTLIYLPHVWMGWGKGGVVFWDKLLEVFLLNLAGLSVGALSDMERKQRARNQELQTLASLGEAAASVAHEMKNVLIPIRGFLRRIKKIDSLNGKSAAYLEIVERGSTRLENMTKDMLAFARQAPLQKEEVDVRTLFEEIQEGLQEEFEQKGVRIICRCDDGSERAFMDPEKIRQALVNLLQNALHASPEGAEVRLLARRNEQYMEMVVQDKGNGIPEECLDRVFLPFFTTKSQGTGLGMAITRRIIEGQGGDIKVESSPGAGTRVLLKIPLIR